MPAAAWEVLVPRTDGGVVLQGVVVVAVALSWLPLARRWHVMQLWAGTILLAAGLFGVRSVH